MQLEKSKEGLEQSSEIPEEWQVINLGEYLELRSGESNPTRNLSPDNSIPVYGANGITGFYTEYLMSEPNGYKAMIV
jgi:type I restriction enzyme S subunit